MRLRGSMNRRDEDRRIRLLASRKAVIAARICAVCTDLSPADFDKLVERMALVEIKYSLRRNEDFFRAETALAFADQNLPLSSAKELQ